MGVVYPGQYPHYPPPRPPPKSGLSPVVIVLIVAGVLLTMGGATCAAGALFFMAQKPAPDPSERGAVDAGGLSLPSAPPSATGDQAPIAEDDAVADETRSEPEAAKTADSAKKSGASAGSSWRCTASASVRVCGFAGACNYQMVFGNGFSKDRFVASQQAKSSCEGIARAKGASAVCVVQCSAR